MKTQRKPLEKIIANLKAVLQKNPCETETWSSGLHPDWFKVLLYLK
jgi:hypothetical protein